MQRTIVVVMQINQSFLNGNKAATETDGEYITDVIIEGIASASHNDKKIIKRNNVLKILSVTTISRDD
jgi:hypothetical protein